MTTPEVARNRAQAALDEAAYDLDAAITAERIERESAARLHASDVRRWRNDRRALRGLRTVTP